MRRRRSRVRRLIPFVATGVIIVAAFGSCSHINSERVARALEERGDYTQIKDACVSLIAVAETGEVTLRAQDPRLPQIFRSLAPYNYPIHVRSDTVTLEIKEGWGGAYGFGFEVQQTSILDSEIYFYHKRLFGADVVLDEDGRPIEPLG